MVYVERKKLEDFCTAIFRAAGLPDDEARDSAVILVAADARGIQSHGTGRIRRYLAGIKSGEMKAGVQPRVLHETPMSLTLDACGATGLHLSRKTMDTVIAKAKEHGFGAASVRNSNHFGIAGFYAEAAARQDCIGIAMTNTAALGVPTFARTAAFGTNPIAFAAPADADENGRPRMFCLDMATTVITRGKVEVYDREKKKLPEGWAVGTDGRVTTDPARLLDDMLHGRGGGILPLGGEGEAFSGYKGYGLAAMVDVLTALCSGGVFGRNVHDSENTSARVCHFFAAVRIDLFRPADEFKRDAGRFLSELNALSPAEGATRVYYPGQKEHEAEAESARRGVPLTDTVWKNLSAAAGELGVEVPVTTSST